MSTVLDVRAAGFAPAARLLASWWAPPTAGEVDRWAEGWDEAVEIAGLLGVSSASVDVLRGAAEEVEPDALREEYERLLVSTRPGAVRALRVAVARRPASAARPAHGCVRGGGRAHLRRHRTARAARRARAAQPLIRVEWEALAYAFEHKSNRRCRVAGARSPGGMDAGILRGGRRGDRSSPSTRSSHS